MDSENGFPLLKEAMAKFKTVVQELNDATKEVKDHYSRIVEITSIPTYEEWFSYNKDMQKKVVAQQSLIKEKIVEYKTCYKELAFLLPMNIVVSIPGEDVVIRYNHSITINADSYSMRWEG
jgi:hypothetical protein